MEQKLFWILLLCVSFPCFFQQAGSSQKENRCYSLFKESSLKTKETQIEESSLKTKETQIEESSSKTKETQIEESSSKTKETQTDKDVVESLIRKVINNQDTDIKLSECGAGCFKLDSSLSRTEYELLIDSKAVSPLQEGSVLTVPSLKQLESSVIRRWLIGHELHPYTSQAVSFSSKTAVLRPSQQIAVSDFKEALSKGYSRFLHISPTSTGKSPVLAKNLIEKLKNKNSKKLSFISVDKIKLVDQLHKQIQAEAKAVDFDLKQVHWIAKQQKSFVKQISKALKSEKPVVISLTLKSFISQMEKLKERHPLIYSRVVKDTDGIYIDEVHHLGAKQTSRFILDLAEKSQAFLYGATATPVHKDLEIQALFEKVHWSYLEETSFDSLPPSMVIDQLSLSIQKGDITPFNDIYVVLAEKLVSLAESPVFIQKPDQALFSVNPEHYARLRDLLGVIFESNRKGMIIVSTIREAEELSEFLNEKGMMGIEFEAYHSGMSVERREDVFRNSREKEFHYIVAVRALDEGINLPHLSAYIDLNPHISVKQIVHRIGRVLRPSLDKLKADIFILSSYKDSEKTRELMDSVEQIKESSGLKDRRISVLKRAVLKDLSRGSYEFVLRQEEFWKVEKSFPSYEEAQRIAQQAGITTQQEYRKRYKDLGLPSNPNRNYKDQWQGLGEFLGTGRIRTRGTDFPSYEEAQRIAQQAGITTNKEYNKRYKGLELGLPSNPDGFYKEQWQGWREFLGTGRIRGTDFPSYKEAQRIAQQARITTAEEYHKRYKELGLPSNPNRNYKDQWQSWGVFLGTGRTRRTDFPSYEEAQRIAQQAGITTEQEHRKRYKELGLPSSPDGFYKEQWQDWGEFLGTGRTRGTDFPSYEEAQRIAQQAGITTGQEHRKRYKELGLPSHPDGFYKEQWQSWGVFLGTERTATKSFPSYEEAQRIAQQAGIKSSLEYKKRYKELGLPSTPYRNYEKQWQGLREFLGRTGRIRRTNFPSYEEAQRIAQQAGITTQKEYQKRYKELKLPSAPYAYYKDQWQGLGEFLRTGRIRTRGTDFPSYEEAQRIAQRAGITTAQAYKKRYKELGLPSNPDGFYKDQWQGWREFLGTGRIRGTDFPSYKEAQRIAQQARITTVEEYKKRYKELGLPSAPYAYYKEQWQGLGKFLGTGRTRRTDFPSYEEAQRIVQQAGIKSSLEYKKRYNGLGLPSASNRTYKDQWQGWREFLGTGISSKNFPSYEEAQRIVQQAGITTAREYKERYKELGLPSSPDGFYKDQWQGWGEFLGTGRIRGTDFPSYEEAQRIAQQAGITTQQEYNKRYKELGLPSDSYRFYKEQWQGLREFLGTGRIRGTNFPSYEEAQRIVQQAGITTAPEYRKRYKELGLPSNPHGFYKDQWQGWGEFLGTGRTIGTDFPSYEEAQRITQQAGITTQKEYQKRYKELGLPSAPYAYYKEQWQGLREFLGTSL